MEFLQLSTELSLCPFSLHFPHISLLCSVFFRPEEFFLRSLASCSSKPFLVTVLSPTIFIVAMSGSKLGYFDSNYFSFCPRSFLAADWSIPYLFFLFEPLPSKVCGSRFYSYPSLFMPELDIIIFVDSSVWVSSPCLFFIRAEMGMIFRHLAQLKSS